jgi:hypothetical protein
VDLHHRSLIRLFFLKDTSPSHPQALSLDNDRRYREHNFHLYPGSQCRYEKFPLVANGSFILPQSHKYATYGIVPNTAPSDGENDSEDTLPGSALSAPIEALQDLANAAVEAANAPELSPRYVGVYTTRSSRPLQL